MEAASLILHYRNLQIRSDDIKDDARYIEEIAFWTMHSFKHLEEQIEKRGYIVSADGMIAGMQGLMPRKLTNGSQC